MADSLDDELARLDRAWERERERFLIAGRPPSAWAARIAGTTALLLGTALMVVGLRHAQPGAIFIATPMLFGGLIVLFAGRHRARQYTRARDSYLARRAKTLENKMPEAE